MPVKLCGQAGCGGVATYRGYCAEHSRRRERQVRSPEAKKVYGSKRWRNARRAQLGREPICEACNGRLAEHVHHRKDLADGGAPFDPANLSSLCAACHSRITRGRQVA